MIEITRSNNTDSGQCPREGYIHIDCLSLLLISFVEEKCVIDFFGLSHTKLLKAPQVSTTYSVSFGASSSKEEAGIAQWLSDGLVVERCRVRVPAVVSSSVSKHPSKSLIQTAHTHTHTHKQ